MTFGCCLSKVTTDTEVTHIQDRLPSLLWTCALAFSMPNVRCPKTQTEKSGVSLSLQEFSKMYWLPSDIQEDKYSPYIVFIHVVTLSVLCACAPAMKNMPGGVHPTALNYFHSLSAVDGSSQNSRLLICSRSFITVVHFG